MSTDVKFVLDELKQGIQYSNILKITYDETPINNDDLLEENKTQIMPSVEIDDANTDPKKKFFTVIMCDPDAPSEKDPSSGPYLHWVHANSTKFNLSDGSILCEYDGPGPPAGTGTHRYIFFLYESDKEIKNQKINDSERPQFKLKKFVNDNGLKLVAATNFKVNASKS
ncbi:unnamed protein product [Didymodactylos carnosus]|uniref:Phosphatidylethanolamine-binding protein n=1 Tax=Didymodactylos carnosus TaxID=1234261 RepID=A0A815MZI6_9BILA|nr:unnamed protein product [Didymodactylos carnosus]CAF1429776.1 unnamed protein product [Didymodactylos carnosus]CAF4080480.1 unnamed protein product [Didymodactylos carnosus]CAF4308851.1 unnamed protein product [Didymodactylos carnosus]